MQQQTVAAEFLPEQRIVFAVAVCGVPYNWMENMLQMAAELVFAPSFGLQFQQGIACCKVASDRVGEFGGR